jgi:hypothetical protein
MTSYREKLVLFVSCIILIGCQELHPSDQKTEIEYKKTNYSFDVKKPELLDISIGQKRSFFQENGFNFLSIKTESEAGINEIYRLDYEGQTIDLAFDEIDEVYEIVTSSDKLQDSFGNGVGSSLANLKLSYPVGLFILSSEEGRVANFITPGHVIFAFDIEDFPAGCFDFPRDCVYDDTTKYVNQVKVIDINFTDYLNSLDVDKN